MKAILCQPERELTVHFPVRMDDGTIRVFDGYRVQHSSPAARPRAVSATTRMSPSTK